MCSANQCRSPMAEALLRRHLDAWGTPAVVSSAGFLSDGRPATDDAIATMAARGIDIAGHRSRKVTAEMAETADLIVTMSREHVAQLAGVAPAAWTRAFPIKDLLRRAASTPRAGGEAADAWVARLGDGRTTRDVQAGTAADDVADPIGQPREVYERTAGELDELMGALAAVVA